MPWGPRPTTQDLPPLSGTDCSWRCVRTGIAMALFEFFAGADGSHVGHAIDGEDAVEVIDFVLQQFGEIVRFCGADLSRSAAQILITHGNVAMTLDLHEDRQEAEARVPADDFLGAAFNDFRIDERPRVGIGKFEKDDALEHAELRSCDAASVAGGRAPVA